MKVKIGNTGKILFAVLFGIGLFFGARWYQNKPRTVGKAKELGSIELPDLPGATLSGKVVKLAAPSTKLSQKSGLLQVEHQMMGWQAQNGILLANGDSLTTENSLMEAAGINMWIHRQDNTTISETEFINYIKDYASGKRTDGMFVTYMASGLDNYLSTINDKIKDLGPEYAALAFSVPGISLGEDQVIGDKRFKDNSQLLRGAVAHGFKEDGDLDLILKYCKGLNIPINPDASLYYPDALNLSYATDYLQAVVDYNHNIKQTRKIVINGVTTGRDTSIGIDLVASWTPGDVNAHNGRGGVTLISTGIYRSIMPAITIGCKKFINTNRDKMIAMTIAIGKAGDQINSFKDAKFNACKIGFKVWNQETPEYWFKYFDGVDIDKDTHLGGSGVFNLNQSANIFGLTGGRDIFKDIYNTFSKIHSDLYPEDYKFIANYADVVDKSIIRDALQHENDADGQLGVKTTVDYTKTTNEVIGNKNYAIQFATGQSTIVDTKVLDDIATELGVTDGLAVVIYGHTDNVGVETQNQILSEARANSVKTYLISKGIDSKRFIEIKGFGSTNPIADNSTSSGRNQNRRVQIILKK